MRGCFPMPWYLGLFFGALVVDAQNEQCEAWAAQGQCFANPDFMLSSCGAACDAAAGDIEAQQEAHDEACRQWASVGECDVNPGFMLNFCAKACGCAYEITQEVDRENVPCRYWSEGQLSISPGYEHTDHPENWKIDILKVGNGCTVLPLKWTDNRMATKFVAMDEDCNVMGYSREISGTRYVRDLTVNNDGSVTWIGQADYSFNMSSEEISGICQCGDSGGFKVTSGHEYCEVDVNGCIHDGADSYANHERCEFTFTGDALLYAVDFDIEYNSSCSWDYLEVEGKGKFCGSAFEPMLVTGTTDFTFYTDYSVTRRGFMICVQSWN